MTVHERDSVDGKKANSTYDGIYDTLKMKKTEGYESPFLGSKEPRKLAVDLKKLKIQEELGKTGKIYLGLSGIFFGNYFKEDSSQ